MSLEPIIAPGATSGWIDPALAPEKAGGLSGGQRKLLELGRALMMEPRYILPDEPFAGVNPALVEEISERRSSGPPISRQSPDARVRGAHSWM